MNWYLGSLKYSWPRFEFLWCKEPRISSPSEKYLLLKFCALDRITKRSLLWLTTSQTAHLLHKIFFLILFKKNFAKYFNVLKSWRELFLRILSSFALNVWPLRASEGGWPDTWLAADVKGAVTNPRGGNLPNRHCTSNLHNLIWST